MTPCLIAKPSTSRLSAAKGVQILGSLFYIWKNSAFKGGTASRIPGEPIPFYRPGCNPQPAKCLIAQYVLRHCCVYGLSGKISHPSSFELQSCWLLSFTPNTDLCLFSGILSLAVLLQHKIYWVYANYSLTFASLSVKNGDIIPLLRR